MGEGKEKKNGESSTAKQVKDQWKRLKQKLSQIKSPIKHILSKKAVRSTLS
jgi:predicted lipoprotein